MIQIYNIKNLALYLREYYFIIGMNGYHFGIRITKSEEEYLLKIHFWKWVLIIRNPHNKQKEQK
jgi:hypothetical protein